MSWFSFISQISQRLHELQDMDYLFFYNAGIAVPWLLPTSSIWVMDYNYQMMELMPDYSTKYILLFYENMKKWKLRIRMQPKLNIHDDQSQIS